jgi:hypothetical protein
VETHTRRYSTGIPVLLWVGTIGFAIKYWVDKAAVLHFYKVPLHFYKAPDPQPRLAAPAPTHSPDAVVRAAV